MRPRQPFGRLILKSMPACFCPGYWRSDMSWTDGEIQPYGWMIELLRDEVERSQQRDLRVAALG
ncbi:hypothetical protein MES5069_550118 [Mesorhizobium escarrei]|uniref:Uncharacterized protein n=1 Tax=Mesorhizobium escarrei TaxID=666018 RepID=A0ABM9ECP3_9HYPH|nr:hypothetical protein MES5069_550118 [Mesorhizobium escarrei]